MSVITTTVLLPIVMASAPQMRGVQSVAIVVVGNHAHLAETIDQLWEGLEWWEARLDDLLWQVQISYKPIEGIDVTTIDICDRDQRQALLTTIGPLPPNAIVLIDNDSGEGHFLCQGEPRGVMDYTIPGLGIVETSAVASDDFGAITAHIIGHLYGAPDNAAGDIMDARSIWYAYRNGVVSAGTLHAIGRS